MDSGQPPTSRKTEQLQVFAKRFALSSLRKIPELVEVVPEVDSSELAPEQIFQTLKDYFQSYPEGNQHFRNLILELVTSSLLLDIEEILCEYPMRREVARVLLQLTYSTQFLAKREGGD